MYFLLKNRKKKMIMVILLKLLVLYLGPGVILSLSQDGVYLQHMKQTLWDPDNSLSNWSLLDDTPCEWTGITCNANAVTEVHLPSLNLAGKLSVNIICLITTLRTLSLPNNSLNSSLPNTFPTCPNLTHLDLSQNNLIGPLPLSLPPSLLHLDLSGNNLVGPIPPEFGNLPNLRNLSLVSNILTGPIPSNLGNLLTLNQLNLSANPFSGLIPPQLGSISSLQILWLSDCGLSGPIPHTLGLLQNLVDLDLSNNALSGPIPSSITNLPNAVQIELYNNSLSGNFPPTGWRNMRSLRRLDASMNLLEGPIPPELCALPLESLHAFQNRLSGTLPRSIADSPNLRDLMLFGNWFTGSLPPNLGMNSSLESIDVAYNLFSGEIPAGLCEGGVLTSIVILNNSFTGRIPSRLAGCRSLVRIRMGNNLLSGEVPMGFWTLPNVELFQILQNSLTGIIPESIGEALSLTSLVINNNNLTGRIPFEIGHLKNLVLFSGNNNGFSEALPNSIGNLTRLEKLDLRNNRFSGWIPSEITYMRRLNELNLANNGLYGEIPDDIGRLSTLNYLDLSGNRLTGRIPLTMQNLKLNVLNLSHNRLTGEIPPLLANGLYVHSFMDNPGLCRKSDPGNRAYIWSLCSILILASLAFVAAVIWFYLRCRKIRNANTAVDKSKWTLMSFYKLDFSEHEILDCFDEDNVIGSGSSGKVYKAPLSNGEAVAVKKLWEKSKKDDEVKEIEHNELFETEVTTLGKIRHKNIVKLWCCCTSKDCKLLVYEYMPNGSLGDLLHSNNKGRQLLDWPNRYRIAVDAAEGLAYLHHDCIPPIVHRDVKSNNILLDHNFVAKLSDFGVAKVIDSASCRTNLTSAIVGSHGYIAPEYGYTCHVNEKSDTYSFGVVILELVTGRPPTDVEFREGDLVKWVRATLDQKCVEHVLDPRIDVRFKEQACKVLNVGLQCSSPLPINRPAMRGVVRMLQEIRVDNKMKEGGKREGKLTPYYYEDGVSEWSI